MAFLLFNNNFVLEPRVADFGEIIKGDDFVAPTFNVVVVGRMTNPFDKFTLAESSSTIKARAFILFGSRVIFILYREIKS
mmetsp:Transcript_22999/g.32190  ORF Transcript_22999/g.32190 Transcript_22999/m.32190 type:complete len:80 (+) Transcript_22999:589-828(+)